jgi:hypothetical protein
MLKIEKNHEHFVIVGPLAKFLQLKLILRPAQQSEFGMLGLRGCKILVLNVREHKTAENLKKHLSKNFSAAKARMTNILPVRPMPSV